MGDTAFQLTMETKLEQIAAKARCKPKLRFTSLAHHISRDRVWRNLSQIPKWSAAGVDGQTVEAAKKSFDGWIEPMLQSIHRQGYRAPDIRRVYIPKPGKTEKRPLGVPTVADRALQRSTAEVLSAIYEQDFLPSSFGGRPKLSAHHALATLNEVIAGLAALRRAAVPAGRILGRSFVAAPFFISSVRHGNG
jgi:RNA-directed DNA polymerase